LNKALDLKLKTSLKRRSPNHSSARKLLALGICALVGSFILVIGLLASAQTKLSASLFSDDFRFSEYYTNKTQVRMRLSGKRAQPSGPERYLVRELRLETFYEDGQPEITIETPECFYDFAARTVNSAGPLSIRMGDGRLTVTGEGFLWQQAQSLLIISNRVNTKLRELPKSNSKP